MICCRLLAREGIDADRLTQDLRSFELRTTFEDVFPLAAASVEEYLQAVHEMSVLAAIQEAQREAHTSFDHFMFQTSQVRTQHGLPAERNGENERLFDHRSTVHNLVEKAIKCKPGYQPRCQADPVPAQLSPLPGPLCPRCAAQSKLSCVRLQAAWRKQKQAFLQSLSRAPTIAPLPAPANAALLSDRPASGAWPRSHTTTQSEVTGVWGPDSDVAPY